MEYIKKHSAGIFVTALVLLAGVIALIVYIFLDYRTDSREREQYRRMYEVEMKSAAFRLSEELEDGEAMKSYHSAMSAAEYAKKAGLKEAAGLFTRVSDAIASGSADEYVDVIKGYIRGGEFEYPAEPEVEAEKTENKRKYVSSFQLERAQNAANSLFGVKNALKFVESSPGDSLIFSCRNAYAVIDANSGIPREASISLTQKPPVLSDEECVMAAQSYLREFFPASDYADASLSGVSHERDNVLSAEFFIRGRKITLMVERSRGKLVGLTSGDRV